MPESRWMSPLFYAGTVAMFLILAAPIFLFSWPRWTLIVAYLLAPIGGFKCVGWYLERKPDARYLTRDKVDGMGYVWAPIDVLMPYLIHGFLLLVVVLWFRR